MSGKVRVRAALPKKKAKRRKPAQVGPQPVPRIAQLLALAHQIDGMIRRGEIESMAEAARLLGVTRARMSQILNLLLLSPAVQEQVLLEEEGDRLSYERRWRRTTTQRTWAKQIRELRNSAP